jgi:hypothetical protein
VHQGLTSFRSGWSACQRACRLKVCTLHLCDLQEPQLVAGDSTSKTPCFSLKSRNGKQLYLSRFGTHCHLQSLIDTLSMLLGINQDHKPTFSGPSEAKRFIN